MLLRFSFGKADSSLIISSETNTEGFRAQKSLLFKDIIEKLSDIEVVLYDERLTTVYADSLLNSGGTKGKDKKKKIDAVSAAVILQDYIDSLK